MGISKTSDHIQIKIKMPNPSQEPPASSKAPNEDLKDMDILCNFNIKIESWNSDQCYIKDNWPYSNQNQDAKHQSRTSSVLQSPKWGLKGNGCSLHLQNQDREPKFSIWVYQRPVHSVPRIDFFGKNSNLVFWWKIINYSEFDLVMCFLQGVLGFLSKIHYFVAHI